MRRYFLRPIRQTTLLTIACVAVLVGLALARRVTFDTGWLVLVGVVAAIAAWRPKNAVTALVLVMAGLMLGLWRGSHYMQVSQQYNDLLRVPITMQARAESDSVYGKNSQMDFTVSDITITSPQALRLPGKVQVQGFGIPMVYKGDILELHGSLSRTRGANQARMSFAKISLKQRGGNVVDGLRRRFMAALQSTLPEPHASFGGGLLIGQRATIPEETNEQLSITGLTHIVAVSGANLTIIVEAMRRLMGKRSKFQSTFAATGLLVVFLLLTGMSASIVRAALVSALSLYAWYYGRAFKPVLLISLAATITALWNPFYLWSDLAWYLSFVSFMGVLLLAPAAIRLVSTRQEPKLLASLLTETVSAQVMTLPLIMYIFGRISLIGLVANILVVPLVPLAMLLTVIAGLAGMVMGPIAGWFAWPARMLLIYMLDMAAVLSRVPHAAAEQYISLPTMIVSYCGITVIMLLLWRKVRRKAQIAVKDSSKQGRNAILTE